MFEKFEKKMSIERLAEDHFSWINAFLVDMMTYKQYLAYGIYAVGKVIDKFDEVYGAITLRESIDKIRKCLERATKRNKELAGQAYCDAMDETLNRYNLIANIAFAVGYLAFSAKYDDRCMAANSIDFVIESVAKKERKKLQKEIINHGIKILVKEKTITAREISEER